MCVGELQSRWKTLGCSQHMTGNDSMFTSLEDPGDHEHVTYGDNSWGKVLGLGRIAIRILFAYSSHHNIKLYQMDVKSAFLNGVINKFVNNAI